MKARWSFRKELLNCAHWQEQTPLNVRQFNEVVAPVKAQSALIFRVHDNGSRGGPGGSEDKLLPTPKSSEARSSRGGHCTHYVVTIAELLCRKRHGLPRPGGQHIDQCPWQIRFAADRNAPPRPGDFVH